MKIEKRLRRVVNGLAAASVLLFAPFAMANNAYRADAGSGAHADQIYWMDWSGYSSVADGTTAFSFNLADGSVLSLDLTRTGSGTRKFEGVCSPTYNGSAMGNIGYTWSTYPGTCAGNVSVNGRPNVVLYPTDGSIGTNVSFKLSNISLVNPRGDAVDEFEIILVDGESMDTGDGAGGKITFISTGDSWNQLERLPATGRNGPAILPGIGTGTVVEAAQSAPVAAWLVTTAKPATGTFDVTASITSTAKQGIMLGIRWGAVRLTKNIVSRGDPSDQFTYRILNNATPPLSIGRGACTAALPGAIGDCTTSGTTTGAQDTLSASILPGNIVTLAEDMAPGSASSLAQYKKTIQCTNSNAGSTTVLPGNGAAIAYDPANPPTLDVRNADDLVDCVITNAVEADVAVTKTGPATVAPGATINYELIVSNNGPGNASGTLFSDAVPAAITAVAASCGAVTGGAVCNNADITVAGNAVSGFIATLPTGATAKILITGTAPATVQAVLNAAHVDPPVGTTDPDEDNNDSSTVTTNVVDADMQATITLPPTANAGDPVHGTFTCTNNGPGVAANATCTVAGLPAGAVVFCTPAPPVATLPVGGAINCTVDFTAPLTGPISGTATAGSDTPDPNPANNTAVATLAITPLANLAITKVASPAGTYLPGQSLNYSITVVNNGPSGVSGASVLDTVPSNVAVSTWSCVATGAGADCDTTQAGSGATGTTNTIALTQVALPSGTSLLISVTGTVDLAATGTITNTASVTPPTGTTCSTPPCVRGSTVTNSNGGAPQLSIQKSATPAAFAVGQTGTYSVLVGNSGTSATTGTITVTDPLPPGITTTATPSGTGWNCSASTPTNVVCSTNAVLSPGANAPIISVPVAIAAGTTSPARNVAGTSGGGDSGCPAAPRCSSAIETPVDAPLIDVEKTLQGTLIVGVEASYVITATNNGQAPTLVGTLVDTIPAGLSIGTLPTGCSAAGQVITCALPAGIAVGGSISYTIPVTPQASADGQNVSNTASGNGGGDPSCPSADHCNDTVTNTVTAPQLQLIKTATPSPFVVGQPATYTLTLTNIGTAPTTAITTIADTVPSGLTLGALPTDCSATGQQVTCTVAAGLATGAPVSFTIPVTPTDTLNGQSVTNAAGATGGGDPGCPAGMPIADLPARCRHDVTTPVNAPQLTLVKTASAAAFVVGVPASYALQVTNTGSASTTAAATITDVVPAGLTLGTLPTGCSATGQQVDCTIAAGLAAGASVTFVVPVTPTLAATPGVSNTATVAGGGDPTCPKTANCSSTVKTPVGAPALQLVKTASDAAFVVGVPASYLLTVTNIGTTATTADASVIDNVPGNLVIGALSPGCVAAGQQVTCTVLDGLAPGASTSFTIAVTPSAAASGSTLTNTAMVAGGGDPTCPGKDNPNCISTVDTPVGAPALQIVKTASDTNFVVGVPASYTLTVTNVGAAATTAAATISDNVPTALTLGAVSTGCSATGQQVTCTIAAGLAAGASTSFLIAVTPLADASGTTLSNTATVAGGGDPSCPTGASCSSTVTTPVDAPALTLVKTASDGGFAVGVPASYTLTVTNTGNAATTAPATVVDNVPAALTLGVLPSGCTAAGQQVSCTVAAGLAAGASTSFILAVTPMESAAGSTLTNTATVSGGGDPRCPAAAQCSSTVTTPVDAPVLTIQKTASDASFVVGVPASYALTVTNSGTVATSAEAVVTDDVPAALDIGALPGGCASVGQQIACTIPAGLAAGASAVFTIEVTPTAAASGTTLSNTAGVSGGGDPACPAAARCSSTVATPVNAPLLTIVKSGPASAVPGGTIVYAITVTNAGTAVATHAVLGDVPPAGLTFVSAEAPCTSGFPCDLGDLLPGQSITVATTFAIAPSFSGSLVNQASVTSDQTVQISSSATTIVPVTPGGETIQSVPVDARWMLSLMVLLMLGVVLGRVRTLG